MRKLMGLEVCMAASPGTSNLIEIEKLSAALCSVYKGLCFLCAASCSWLNYLWWNKS